MYKNRVGIYSGSFDPVHVGHIRLAEYIAQSDYVDEVWLMVTPQNPLKQSRKMQSNHNRLKMVQIATQKSENITASDFEFLLPQPTYTYITLCRLREKYPDYQFRLIIGSDNWTLFDKWRDSERIINEFGLIVYPRPGYDVADIRLPKNVILLREAPMTDISSTEIRSALTLSLDTSEMLHPNVKDYIISNGLYCD